MNLNFLKKSFLIVLFVSSYVSYSQNQVNIPENVILNYDFQYIDVYGRPVSWYPQNTKRQYLIVKAKRVDVDTLNICMSITPKPNANEDRGVGLMNTGIVAKQLFKDKKKVTIKAKIKTENINDGIASIWMQLNGDKVIIADKNCDAQSPKGTTDWTEYSIELPLTENVNSIAFGCKMSGKGIAYFDDFEVLFDGESFSKK